jgi:probable rRNA maturation factor
MEIIIRNNQRLIRINKLRIESILKKVLKRLTLSHRSYSLLDSAEVSVLFVNDRKMRELNLQYRGKDKTTDVLSFPQYSAEVRKCGSDGTKGFQTSKLPDFRTSALVLGDIVISLPRAKRQALEHGVTFYEEVTRLLIHGLLHLLGYDHERNKYQARKMREMEKELLSALPLYSIKQTSYLI